MEGPATLPRAARALDSWEAFREWRRSKCPHVPRGDLIGEVVSRKNEMNNAAMGLMGEVGEVCGRLWHRARTTPRNVPPLLTEDTTDGVVGECGDVLFYVDWLADCHGLTMKDVVAEGASSFLLPLRFSPGEFWQCDLLAAVAHFGEACDLTKKQVFHGSEVGPDKIRECLRLGLVSLGVFMACFGADLGGAAAAVVSKLDRRYPRGFEPGGGDRSGAGR